MIDTIKNLLKKHALLLFSFVCSAVILFICSKSSPLYPMNDWVDVHCFLTLGRGLLHGSIPYVDLYEQKGPFLYFIYAIISLFCGEKMWGQYLFEVLTYGLFLYFSARLAGLFLGEKSFTLYAIVPTLGAIVACCSSFSHGGSVEQASLFTFAYGLYSVIRACKEDRPLTFREALTNGLLAGVLFWVKYTMLGFYLGLALFVLVFYLVRIRSFKKLMAVIGQFLLGIGILSAVVVLFFLCVGGIEELFTCYFYNNIFLYKSESTEPFLTMIFNRLRGGLMYNSTMSYCIYLGFGWLIFRSRKYVMELIGICLTFIGLTIATYTGASYGYYSLVLGAYVVFGLIAAVVLLREFRVIALVQKITAKSRTLIALTILCITLGFSLFAVKNSNNLYMLRYDREELPQYRFSKIINETEDATVLNFGFLDGGFYYAADKVPDCRFFCCFNVAAPGMWQTQAAYVKNEQADYVITRRHQLEDYSDHFDSYELIDSVTLYYEGIDFTYYLYRLKGEIQ